MKTTAKIGGLLTIMTMILIGCSTEKNTWINRNYHSLTAHYNGWYNANELIDQGMTSYRDGRVEDYYEILPIDPVPDTAEVSALYPAIDTAIVKCKKVIQNHSMPSNDRPARKKEEHNRWIDENWTTIGIASYYRRDYEGAMKSFKFVRKFYSNDPSLYVGELWMAKTNIATGNLTEAKFNLDNLDKAIADEKSREEEKPSKRSKRSKFTKKKSKDDEIAKVPKDILFDLEKTKAQLALEKDDKERAIECLEASLEHARFKDNVARVHFILGQLYADQGNKAEATEHFTKVIKGRAKYEMVFNARLKRAFLGTGEKVKKDLKKMMKDPKNAEFKDQIYYALAEIEFNEGNDQAAIDNLHKSTFYSTKNTRQKGMSYERLGDYRFERREYVQAQKYYDSCARVIKDSYPNADGIRGKAQSLAKLVTAVETANREDSLQRIAMMDESTREKFIKEEIKRIKKAEEERKRREAERLRELQENQNLSVDAGNGSKWYWNNPKVVREGEEEFRRLWGQRENEDNWRRSNKLDVNINIDSNDVVDGDAPQQPEDTLTVEHMLSFVPLTDSMMEASNTRLMKALFDAGRIYRDQLKEPEYAKKQFKAAVDKGIMSDPHDLLSAYQLYDMAKENDAVTAENYKQYILVNYPSSDYANYLRDPDYFIKKKERDALAVQEYVKVLERYERALYYPVMTKADKVINEEPDNIYRSKYMLLKAMCLGETERDKKKLLPVLEMLVEEYPDTEEAERGREMIDIINNGYSDNIEFVDNTGIYQFDERAPMRVIVFLPEGVSSQSGISRVSAFNNEYFKLEGLTLDSKLFGKDQQSIVMIKEFEDEIKASTYITAFKNTKKHLLTLNEAKIFMISKENMATLFKRMSLQEYEDFYKQYY
jgi:tetratricopeptide (TPR) repeat protein